MARGRRVDERLDRAPFRFPRPHRGGVLRWSVATALVALAALVLLAGTPPVATVCPSPAPGGSDRPVPPAGTVGVPVFVAVAGAADVVRRGDRVDLVTLDPAAPGSAASTAGGGALLAEDVLVLAVRPADDGPAGGSALYVAAPPAAARRLAGAAPQLRVAITVRPP